jgi:hypothetical protein
LATDGRYILTLFVRNLTNKKTDKEPLSIIDKPSAREQNVPLQPFAEISKK